MNESLRNLNTWFAQNKLNLYPSKTRYMIINGQNMQENLVNLGATYIDNGLNAMKKDSK